MITFTCKGKGCSPRQWECSLEILQIGNPCEAELCARGSRFHLIVGKHSYGNYLCIPNWAVGTELSTLTDLFWNEERLRHYSRMNIPFAKCTLFADQVHPFPIQVNVIIVRHLPASHVQ